MIRLASLLCLLGTPLSAQLKISELLLDPPGANGANQIVELVNVGATSVTPGPNWTLCARPLYPPLPQIAVPAGGVVRLHIGVVGTDSATDWFVPGIPVLALDGELAIYSTNIAFADPTQMVDFVSWGNGAASPFNSRMSTAISAQLWTSATAHVTLPAEGPQTAAWLGGGAGVGPGAWFIDGTPTLGAPNNPAVFEAFAAGCAGSVGEPNVGVPSTNQAPGPTPAPLPSHAAVCGPSAGNVTCAVADGHSCAEIAVDIRELNGDGAPFPQLTKSTICVGSANAR